MHISLILNKVVEYIYKRRLNFILSLIILTITLYLMILVMQMYYNSNYYIYETKKTLKNSDAVNINVLMNLQDPSGYCEIAKELDKELTEEYQDAYGKFMYMDNSFNISDGKESIIPTLYMDNSIMDLCELPLKNASQDGMEENGDVLRGYVGNALKEQYPIGTVLTDTYTGTQIRIVAEIDAGTVWLPSLLFHTQDAVISLDDHIVTEMDTGYFEISSEFYSNTFDSMYIKCSSKKEVEQVKGDIKERADQIGIMVYCYTLDDLIEQEREETRAFVKEMGFLILFVSVIAASAYLSAGLADIYSRHYELAVMYINHVSSIDMFMMLFVENIVKAVISVGISLFLYRQGLADTQLIVFQSLVVPTILISVLIFMFIITLICYKTVNRKKLLAMIGGARL